MQYQAAAGIQGLCPPAWHIPTEAEWFVLESGLYGQGNAGDSLKSGGFSGFNALLSGARAINKSWEFQNFATFFWSSTPSGSTQAWAHGMNDIDPSVSIYPSFRDNAFSVRCVHD